MEGRGRRGWNKQGLGVDRLGEEEILFDLFLLDIKIK